MGIPGHAVGGLLVGDAILPLTNDRALPEEGGNSGVRGSFLHLWDESLPPAFGIITPEARRIEQQMSWGLDIEMLDIAYVMLSLGVDAFPNQTTLSSGLSAHKVGIAHVLIDNSAEICYTVHADRMAVMC